MKRFGFDVSCVYAIVNLRNGKRYIGSTSKFKNRIQMHRFHLRRGTHDNRHLQSSWVKYGEDAFVFGIIEEVPIEQMIDTEQMYLDAAQPNVYNSGVVAAAPTRGRKFTSPMKGMKLSLATRRAMSEAVTRRWKERPFVDFTDAQKERWRAANLASKPRASASNRGQKRSEYTKALLREAWNRRKAKQAPPALCRHGHEYSPQNIRLVKGWNGKLVRRCIACALAGQKRWYRKSRAVEAQAS